MSQASSRQHVETAIAELRVLREEVQLLGSRLDRSLAALSEALEGGSLDGYEHVSFPGSQTPGGERLEASRISEVGSGSSYRPPSSLPSAPSCAGTRAVSQQQGLPQSWEERERIAVGVGQFLRRAVLGEHRGNSGRDQIRQSSRIYLICKDATGTVHTNPVRIVHTFREATEACSRAGSWGDSIFVGLPSKREVKVALTSAGFSWPEGF